MTLAVKKRNDEKTEVTYKCMNHYKNKNECPKHNYIHYDKLYSIINTKLKLMYNFINDNTALD